MQNNRNAEHYHDPTAAEAIKRCKKYVITIPGRFPDLNDMIKLAKQGHGKYQPYAQIKSQLTETVAWIAKAARIPQLKRISVKIMWYEPNAKRDPDNIMAAIKYIMDGLVAAGVIPDDSQKYIAKITHGFVVDRGNPRVVVEIEEAHNV